MLGNAIKSIIKENIGMKSLFCFKNMLCPITPIAGQIRTTYVFKRQHPARPHADEVEVSEMLILKKSRVFDVIETPYNKKLEPLSVLLLKSIAGIGIAGHVVELPRNKARYKIILTKMGVYASPENLEKYKYLIEKGDETLPSSEHVLKTIQVLNRASFSVCMNMENSWTVEPWHVRVALRKGGLIVSEDTITLPQKPITGPNLDLERKEFYITLTINKKEVVNTRMRIHHVATNILDRLPFTEFHNTKKALPIFPEDSPILNKLMRNRKRWVRPDDDDYA